MNEKSSLPLFDPQTVSLCVRDADGTIHALHPDAPDVEPWALCGRDTRIDGRSSAQVGAVLSSPSTAGGCLSSPSCARRARWVVEVRPSGNEFSVGPRER